MVIRTAFKRFFFFVVCIVSTLLAFRPAQSTETSPQFEDFKVKVYKGRPKHVLLKSHPEGHKFRTVLRQGAKDGPNFAGHYTIIQHGCGTMCQVNWIVDAKTGKICDRFSSSFGIQYQVDSALIILNPPTPELLNNFRVNKQKGELPFWSGTIKTVYAHWTGTHLKSLLENDILNYID
jgi:hypothetical protein